MASGLFRGLASTVSAGFVKIGSGLAIAADGTLSALVASLSQLGLVRQTVYNVMDYGAIGDGSSHPLSSVYATLAAAQAVYPFATALTNEIDRCAWQAAINAAQNASGPLSSGVVYGPAGVYTMDAAGLSVTKSNIELQGAGMDATVLRVGAGVTITTYLISAGSVLTQWGNSIRRLTIDANAQNGASITAGSYYVNPGSRLKIQEVGFCNRGNTSGAGAYYMGLTGARQVVEDCWIHHDYIQQPGTATPGAAGAITITISNTAGFVGNDGSGHYGLVIIDPSVSVFAAGFPNGTSQSNVTLTIHSEREHPFPNGAIKSQMLGLYAGQSVVVGMGGTQETCTIAAGGVDYINGTITLSTVVNNHSGEGNVPITYTGATEIAQVSSVAANTSITLVAATQLAHTTAVALLAVPRVGDAIAIGSAGTLSTNSPLTNRGARLRDNEFCSIGLDPIGSSSGNDLIVRGNSVWNCFSGIGITNGLGVVVDHNIVDLRWGNAPIRPPHNAGGIWCGYFWTSTDTGTYYDHIVSDNHFIGGASGIFAVPTPGGSLINGNFGGNNVDTPWAEGVILTGVSNSSLSRNNVYNANQGNYAASSYTGNAIGGITIRSQAGDAASDSLNLENNTVINTNGALSYSVVLYGQGVTNTVLGGNSFKGYTGIRAINTIATGGTYPTLIAFKNTGFNPRGSVNLANAQFVSGGVWSGTGPYSPTLATTYTNTSGVDIELYITAAGTVTSVSVGGVAVMPQALTVGQRILWPALATLSFAGSAAPSAVAYGD